MKSLEILYEDAGCAIINKPAGLAVQGGEKVGASLDKLLSELWPEPPHLVHRLDKETSGLILVAKSGKDAALYSRLMQSREIRKIYLALCSGRPATGEGLLMDSLDIRGQVRPSCTRYRVLKTTGEFSLLELELLTGRTHQIRRHLAGAGLPILGDDKYGDFPLNKKLRREYGLKRLLLHSARLSMKDGAPGFPDISAPLPCHFDGVVKALLEISAGSG
jgi:23S rRNA pseudouridine955/2504/2580 synthase